jgi:transposase InsO family protein
MALKDLPAWAHPIHHSDQGSQYCCHEYVNALAVRGLTISMTERDHCSENALAERMNGILKSEYGLGQKIATKLQARQMVDQGVQLYNERRPHTALAYRTPAAVHHTVDIRPEVAPLRGSAPARRLAYAPPRSGATQPPQLKQRLIIM